jgi:hypothetical protein
LSSPSPERLRAWRLFFERLADREPTVLVFEDMQWADTSLLEFIDYLLEWSRNQPIFILALARPEIHDKRPGWGAGQLESELGREDWIIEPAQNDDAFTEAPDDLWAELKAEGLIASEAPVPEGSGGVHP